MTAAPTPTPPSGTHGVEGALGTVGEYQLLAKIGEGGMGIVHLARRPGGERVALKMLRPHIVGDDEARARLAREVNSLSRIRSRWVAEIVDADPWAPVPFVATRYVPGLPLHDHVTEEGPIGGADLVWLAACLAEGLAAVHEVGVLHRDVKPSNVLMEGRTPILIDFGLARLADDPRLTHTGWLLGTPGYLAPEILYGDDASPASDLHSWAATVAFAATGNPPFGRGPSMAIMDRVRRGEHDLTGVPEPLRDVVAAALDPDPARRPTLLQVLEWLRPQTTRPASRAETPAPPTGVGEDIFTLPLALAAQGAVEAPTAHAPEPEDLPPPTLVMPTVVEPRPAPTGPPPSAPPVAPPAAAAPAVAYRPVTTPPVPPASPVGAGSEWERRWDEENGLAEEPAPPVPVAERLRRGTLVTAGALLVGAATAAAPWLTLVGVCLVVWLLRSGSLAASSLRQHQQRRGRKWYDGARTAVASPWHVVASLPGTVGLLLWAAGLGVAAALLCYAVAAGLGATLAVSGAVFAVSLWWGPGGSRVRGPLGTVVVPTSRSVGAWLAAVALVMAATAGLGLRVGAEGTWWAPASERPFAGYSVPEGGILNPGR